jgi:hypothetical protein
VFNPVNAAELIRLSNDNIVHGIIYYNMNDDPLHGAAQVNTLRIFTLQVWKYNTTAMKTFWYSLQLLDVEKRYYYLDVQLPIDILLSIATWY